MSPPAGSAPGGQEAVGSELALFRRWPDLSERIPRVPLATLPTPVERLPDSIAARAWVKRDDLTGEPYGGNKLRKLELLLADAVGTGARRLITVGAAGSNHALATVVHGRRIGFATSLVLFPQRRTERVVRTLLMDHSLGAELRFTRRMESVPLALLSARWAHWGERVYVIPPGGSNARGTLAYVSAGLELAEQVEGGMLPPPDIVHVAAGTLGTAAGIALGLRMAGLSTRVAAYRITSTLVCNRRGLSKLITGAADLLAAAGIPRPDAEAAVLAVELRDEQLGRGYGLETPEGREAGRTLATAGIELDPTYTAKAAAGFLAAARENPSAVHLFWHTLSATEPAAAAEGVSVADLPAPFRRYLER